MTIEYLPEENPMWYHFDEQADRLIPPSGPSNTLDGELLRAASRLIYDWQNNASLNNNSGALEFLIKHLGPFFPERFWRALRPYAYGITKATRILREDDPSVEQLMELLLTFVTLRNVLGEDIPNNDDMLNYQINSEEELQRACLEPAPYTEPEEREEVGFV